MEAWQPWAGVSHDRVCGGVWSFSFQNIMVGGRQWKLSTKRNIFLDVQVRETSGISSNLFMASLWVSVGWCEKALNPVATFQDIFQ